MKNIITLLCGALVLATASCTKKYPEASYSLSTEVAVRIVRISYCGPQYLEKTSASNVLSKEDTITMRFGWRNKFISLMNRNETVDGLYIYLKSLNNNVSKPVLHNIFNANKADTGAPIAFKICDLSSHAVIYSKSDTLRNNINTFITISNPIPLDSGKTLYYYELGTKKNMMSAGVIVTARDKKGRLVTPYEKMLWTN